MPLSTTRRLALLPFLVIAAIVSVDPMVGAAAPSPPALVEHGETADWSESHAWGGGVRHVFAEPGTAGAGDLSLPGGAAIEFVFGCRADAVSGKGYWRFRVGATPPGTGITAVEEKAYGKAVNRLFGGAASLVVVDASGREADRLALQPVDGGLETVGLWDEVIAAMFDASAIRVESSRFVLETGSRDMKATLDGHPRIRCKR
ncbi:hypothetical protein [Pinisolibacter aquiterrae]|uniref:hypothetical protein n=1 Tax=Pinisolibacter aquiterrae TaxID=2815579 RepID=UPI001C3CEA88|nr:hypothetical protein [Pinisolibacter aquiterrae]MBV5262476.1 hypothetical protein [Pinisolibacter aquiterrae]MCC8235888.1 hypothetical protein [Pinisolibacter aquiterrae]